MATTKALTGDTSIADWLADPAGSAILTDMLPQGGQTPGGRSSPSAASRSSAS